MNLNEGLSWKIALDNKWGEPQSESVPESEELILTILVTCTVEASSWGVHSLEEVALWLSDEEESMVLPSIGIGHTWGKI